MENSLFQKLSPELRNQIWELVVARPDALVLGNLASSEGWQQPAITRACKILQKVWVSVPYPLMSCSYSIVAYLLVESLAQRNG